VARTALTWRRLLGLDRSGGPPPATRKGQPLHPWTIPNIIGYFRLALIPVFLGLALSTDDPRYTPATVVFAVIGGTDYLDGIAARLTGQYSRLGALIDPIVDRLLVVSGVIVCWKFELLPRWALAVLAARELFMLLASRFVLKHGLDIEIKMLGRWAVWPTMFSLFLAMVVETWVSEVLLYIGLGMTLATTVQYIIDGRRDWKRRQPSTSA
jgi:CDP-diacylglycerol--glycerol-3-phosphate 3-phosphatidyltransferase